jgi:hypothetical protein
LEERFGPFSKVNTLGENYCVFLIDLEEFTSFGGIGIFAKRLQHPDSQRELPLQR